MLCDLNHLTLTNVQVSEVKYTKYISLKKLFCSTHSKKEGRELVCVKAEV